MRWTNVSETVDARHMVRHGAHAMPPDELDSDDECGFVRDIAAAFALGAVDLAERLRVEQHTLVCPRCARVVRELRTSAALIGLTVPQAQPPLRIKAALFARIDQAARSEAAARPSLLVREQVSTVTLPSSRPVPAMALARAEKGPRGQQRWLSPVAQLRPRLSEWNFGSFAVPLATVPLLLALGIVSAWAFNVREALNERASQVQQLSAQVASLNSQVVALNKSLASMDQFVAAADAKTYPMTPGSPSSSAYGQVIANPGTDQAMLMVWRLNSSHGRYEVVLETNEGTIEPAGELLVNTEGRGVTILDLSQPFAMYRSVHVKPKPQDSTSGVPDAMAQADVLFALIDPNLGSTGDTDGVLMQSP
jgi:outer membrane murein-binding lipoprotein Lpp